MLLQTIGRDMLQAITISVIGFVVAGVIGSLSGMGEPIWDGKGPIAFAFVLVEFIPALLICVFLFRARIGMLFTDRPTVGRSYFVLLGLIAYPLVNQVATLVPEFVRSHGYFEAVGVLGLMSIEVLVSAFVFSLLTNVLFAVGTEVKRDS